MKELILTIISGEVGMSKDPFNYSFELPTNIFPEFIKNFIQVIPRISLKLLEDKTTTEVCWGQQEGMVGNTVIDLLHLFAGKQKMVLIIKDETKK